MKSINNKFRKKRGQALALNTIIMMIIVVVVLVMIVVWYSYSFSKQGDSLDASTDSIIACSNDNTFLTDRKYSDIVPCLANVAECKRSAECNAKMNTVCKYQTSGSGTGTYTPSNAVAGTVPNTGADENLLLISCGDDHVSVLGIAIKGGKCCAIKGN